MINIGGNNAISQLNGIKEGDVQPNAVDLRVEKVWRIENDVFTISEETKVHRGNREFEPWDDGYFYLENGSYLVMMENYIRVAEGEAGWVITRSTLIRNGVHLSTGLYDSGYEGRMFSTLHVNGGLMRIKPGTRIGQYLCFKSESLHTYDGDYGTGKSFDETHS